MDKFEAFYAYLRRQHIKVVIYETILDQIVVDSNDFTAIGLALDGLAAGKNCMADGAKPRRLVSQEVVLAPNRLN